MKKSVAVLLILVTSYIFLVQPVAAFELNVENALETILTVIFGEFPDEWVNTKTFMQLVVFPFIALFAVMYGILAELRIFQRSKISRTVIALTFSFGAGWFSLVSMKGFMILNAAVATWAFGIVLFLGIILWGAARVSEGWYGVSGKHVLKGMKYRESQQKKKEKLQRQQTMYYNTWQRLLRVDIDAAEKARKDYEKVTKDIEDIEKEETGRGGH